MSKIKPVSPYKVINRVENTYRGLTYLICITSVDNALILKAAYVKLPDDHPYIKYIDQQITMKDTKNWKKVHYAYDDIHIDCNYGLTFTEKVIDPTLYQQQFSEGYWIGWDYNHGTDYMEKTDEYLDMLGRTRKEDEAIYLGFMGTKWTLADIEKECHSVIDQLLDRVEK